MSKDMNLIMPLHITLDLWSKVPIPRRTGAHVCARLFLAQTIHAFHMSLDMPAWPGASKSFIMVCGKAIHAFHLGYQWYSGNIFHTIIWYNNSIQYHCACIDFHTNLKLLEMMRWFALSHFLSRWGIGYRSFYFLLYKHRLSIILSFMRFWLGRIVLLCGCK